MTRRHSSWQSEDHSTLCSAARTEPPISDSPDPTLDEGSHSTGSHSTWGNMLGKSLCHLCMLFQNVDGLSPMDEGEVKLTMLQQAINQFELDIAGLTELKTCWDMVDYNLHLPQKARGWWETAHWSL